MIKKWLAILSLLSITAPVFAALGTDEPELLEPDKAFSLSTRVVDGNTIEAQWAIADGYYLYRDKFRFTVEQGDIKLGTIDFPKGKIKKDVTFGDTEVYHKHIMLRIPLQRKTATTDKIKIRFDYQGCNEPIGVCYPPINKSIEFKLPAGTAQAVDSLKSLKSLLKSDDSSQKFLPVEKAFPVTADFKNRNTLAVIFGISEGYYLYRDKIHLTLEAEDGSKASGIEFASYALPRGKKKKDPTYGETEIYTDSFVLDLPLAISNPGLTRSTLRIDYQGCAEDGICYPPNYKTYTLKLKDAGLIEVMAAKSGIASGKAAARPASSETASTSSAKLTDEEKLAKLFAEANLAAILVSLLGFGLVLAFTACMYPMIPILSSIITGQGEHVTPLKGFGLSAVYVGGMATTFGVIGGIVGFFGQQIGVQAYFQNPWIISLFAALFVALALSMFGFYNIQVPASIQSKLNEYSNKQKGGTFIGVAAIGVLSALIVGPCGGPVLLGTLAGAASSSNPLLGFLYMFALAVGMGLPLLVVGAGGGTLLPKAGAWMATVKSVAGVVLLAVAIYFLERVLPAHVYMLMWALLFIVSAIYMGALDSLAADSSGWRRLWKGLGIAMLIYGIIVLLGGLTGARNFNDPLHGSKLISGNAPVAGIAINGTAPAYVKQATGKKSVIKGGLTFIQIKTWEDFQRELKSANRQGYTLMTDFYADWCTYCKQFDDYVFSNSTVQKALANTVLLQADVTALDEDDKLLMKNLKVTVPPAILFYKTDGIESRRQRVIGLMDAKQFLDRINNAF